MLFNSFRLLTISLPLCIRKNAFIFYTLNETLSHSHIMDEQTNNFYYRENSFY